MVPDIAGLRELNKIFKTFTLFDALVVKYKILELYKDTTIYNNVCPRWSHAECKFS